MIKQLFKVPTVHCSSCVMLLEGIEDELPGITKVTVHLKRQEMEVEFDETRVTPEQIIEAAKQEGYKAISK